MRRDRENKKVIFEIEFTEDQIKEAFREAVKRAHLSSKTRTTLDNPEDFDEFLDRVQSDIEYSIFLASGGMYNYNSSDDFTGWLEDAVSNEAYQGFYALEPIEDDDVESTVDEILGEKGAEL